LTEDAELDPGDDQFSLTIQERQLLKALKELFPYFENQGLGRTALALGIVSQ